MELNLIRTNF